MKIRDKLKKKIIINPFKRVFKGIALSLAVTFAGIIMTPDEGYAQENQNYLEQKFDSWTYRCEVPPGALAQQCRVEQYVADEQRPDITFLVMVFKTADGKNWFMRIIAPLGLRLPNGMRFVVDTDTLPGTLPFTRCGTEGCYVDLVDATLIDAMRKAKAFTIIVWPTVEDPVGIPIPLAGFNQALEKLK